SPGRRPEAVMTTCGVTTSGTGGGATRGARAAREVTRRASLLAVAVGVHELRELRPRDPRALLPLAAGPGDRPAAEHDLADHLVVRMHLEPDGGAGLGQFGDVDLTPNAVLAARRLLRHSSPPLLESLRLAFGVGT